MLFPAFSKTLFRSRWILPAGVFLILFAATLLLWQNQRDALRLERQNQFERNTALVTRELRERLQFHAQFLRTLAAYFAARRQVSAEEWREFSGRIRLEENLPGAHLFGFAPAVPGRDLEIFEATVRRDFKLAEFRVFPRPEREIALPVVYMAPQGDGVRRALGFDIYSEPVRRQAIDLAAERDDVVISGPITLVFDRDHPTPGFLMLHPIYRAGMATATVAERRAAFAGVVYAAYRTAELMRFMDWTLARSLAVVVTDGDGHAGGRRIHDASGPDPSPGETEHASRHELAFGHRTWTLHFRQQARPGDAGVFDGPSQTLLAGLAVAFLLSLMVFILSTHRYRAEAYARRITAELRQAEAARRAADRHHREHLEELVRERTAELEAALRETRAAHQAKTEFLANMSHELRTPMHAILGFSGLGIERSRGPGQEKLHQYFERIRQSADRLLDLINDLLDLSKLEAGRAESVAETVDLLALAGDILTQLEPLLLGRQLRVGLEAEPGCAAAVLGSGKQLERIIHNLLANAIKFSPAGGTIAIHVGAGTLPGEGGAPAVPAVVLTVCDEGVGIPEDELDRIFDKFVQSSRTKNGAGGTGLGLAICREIVRIHRGTIEAKNNPHGGACFQVRLPAAGPLKNKAD